MIQNVGIYLECWPGLREVYGMIKDDEHWQLDISGHDLKRLTGLQAGLLTKGWKLEADADTVNLLADDLMHRPEYQSISDLQDYEIRAMLIEYHRLLSRVDRYITKRQQSVNDEMTLCSDGAEILNNTFKDPSRVRS